MNKSSENSVVIPRMDTIFPVEKGNNFYEKG
jgi:hypothetical protein